MKLSTMLFVSILALAAAAPTAGGAAAQSGGGQDKILRPANCPAGQRLNAQKRKCESEATTINTAADGSLQPATALTLNSSTSNVDNPDGAQCVNSGGTWTGGVCATAEKQCIGAGGTWTAGVCMTAEKQCINSGGTWTAGVCIKE